MWLIPIVIAVVGLAAGSVYLLHNKSTGISSQGGTESHISPTATPIPVELATWKDDAGFSFQYPKDLTVNKHEEDQDNYAHVELIHKDHPGGIIVWVKDLPAGVTTLDSLVKKNYTNAMALDTKLGGEPAKKILMTTPTRILTVSAINDSLLFSVEGTMNDEAYWQNVHDTVTGSFTFLSDAPAQAVGAASNVPAGGENDVDEEEVVQ